jgi:membrane protease YdiL (CAAX protease family)
MLSLQEYDYAVAEVRRTRPPRNWYFIGTTLFGVIAQGAGTLGAMVTMILLLLSYGIPLDIPAADLKSLMHQGGWMATAMIGSCPFTLGVIWLATRIARQPFVDYLALRRPEGRELVRALALVLVVQLIWFAVGWLIGQRASEFAIDSYRSARDSGLLAVLLAALLIFVPVNEEFVVRGFLFRGWSQSFLGPGAAIVLTSAVWTALHIQYNAFYLSEIFVIGLILGYFRWRTGSTWLTVIVHAAINLASVIQTALVLAHV